MMNCDQAFEILTCGTAPEADLQQQLDQHLRVCRECRQQAEAFSPAVAMLRETAPEPLSPALSEPARPRRRWEMWSAALILLIVVGLWRHNRPGTPAAASIPAGGSTVKHSPPLRERPDVRSLAMLELREACYHVETWTDSASIDYRCCLVCHEGRGLQQNAQPAECQNCHLQKP